MFVDILECFGWRCALSENGRSEQSSGAGEFAVLGVCFRDVGLWCVRALCVAEWGVGVRERVTRSAVGASDTGR